MAISAERPETESHTGVAELMTGQAKEMVKDIHSEVKHEVSRIHDAKEPVDASQSDHVVRRHVTGLSITFFVLIGLFLVAVIAGIAIFGHH
jgi:hypothetical protein